MCKVLKESERGLLKRSDESKKGYPCPIPSPKVVVGMRLGLLLSYFMEDKSPATGLIQFDRISNLLGGGLEEDKHLPCIVGKNLFCAQIECLCSPNFDF